MDVAPVFVTRKFPPSVGGMETLAESTWRSLALSFPTGAHLVANRRTNRALPLWLPWAVVRTTALVLRGRATVVLAGDALVAAILTPFLRVARTPQLTMVMGLDVTYPNRIYQAVVIPPLRRSDQVIAISQATAAATAEAGVSVDRINVIRLGVSLPSRSPGDRVAARAEIDRRWGTEGVRVVTTLGRLVPRKGVRWFVENVLENLPDDVVYLVGGDGPDRPELEASVLARDLGQRVRILGRVDDSAREDLLRGSDVFVQPNIMVPGDMEGFGLVTLEAALRGTPVVASDLEGLRDAVVDGGTGWLIPSGDPAAWSTHLNTILDSAFPLESRGEEHARTAGELYSELAMGRQLATLLAAAGTRNRRRRP